jgi:DNA-binding MarR family transcriptional regulator
MPLKVDGPEPTDSVVNAVLSASRALVAVAARSLADAAEQVTLAQYRTLVVLASQGPSSLAHLAEAVGVAPATATRMCDRLVRKGLVRRRAVKDNRRQVSLTLSDAGQKLIDDVTTRRRDEIRRIVSAMSLGDYDVLVQALGRFADAAGVVPEQDWSTGWDL